MAVDHLVAQTFDAEVVQPAPFFGEPEIKVFDCLDDVLVGVTNRPAIRLHENPAVLLDAVAADGGRWCHGFEGKAFDFARQTVVATGGGKPVVGRPAKVF